MIFALALALTAILGGTLLTYLYDDDAPLPARLCAGAPIGFAVLALSGLLCASFGGLTLPVLTAAAFTVAAPLLILSHRQRRLQTLLDLTATMQGVRRAALHPDRRALAYCIFYALVTVVLWLFFRGVMFERAGEIYTSLINNDGDLPLHIAIIMGFAQGNNFPPQHPEFAGVRLTYPFLANFVAAMFVRVGAKLHEALLIENMVLAIALVGLLHRWAWNLTRDALAALISPMLILLSGGLGWWLLLQDARDGGPSVFVLLKQLPRDYTVTWDSALLWGDTLKWGNTLTALLGTQRAWMLGLPLFIIVWTLWWQVIDEKASRGDDRDNAADPSSCLTSASPRPDKAVRRMIAAGAIAGLLPLAHAHSFAVLMGMGACLALLFRRWRAWTAFFAVALMLAVPQIWWVTQNSGTRPASFLQMNVGWYTNSLNSFWLFWLQNTGLFIPLLLVALLWRGRRRIVPRQLLLFYLPFMLCFIIPNLVKLAPWEWDNIKVLFYWYIASVPLVALALARFWRRGGVVRGASLALLASLTLAGSLDVWRTISNSSEHQLFDREAVMFANVVTENTHPNALILHAPTHRHPVYLTGRRSLMGNSFHVWSHGLDYEGRAADVRRIYAGAPDADALLKQYGVEYMVLGPVESDALKVDAQGSSSINYLREINESYFERYVKVAEVGSYRLYKVVHYRTKN